MTTVSFSEANLLSLARGALGFGPPHELRRLLATPNEAPDQLAPEAMRLFQQSLARGTTLGLARGGGWRPLGGRRLWERGPAPELVFTPTLYRFLQWVLRAPLQAASLPEPKDVGVFTPAEEAVVLSLLVRARAAGVDGRLLDHPSVRRAPLVVLGCAGLLGERARLTVAPLLELARHGPFVEGLADVLADAWLVAEERKAAVDLPAVLSAIGEAQTLALDAFLGALTTPALRRLAGFLVQAGVRWLDAPPEARHYGRDLRDEAPLAERHAARQRAGAFLRGVVTVADWDQAHRLVRFVDDDYAEAQALVKAWAGLTDARVTAARRLLAELAQLPG